MLRSLMLTVFAGGLFLSAQLGLAATPKSEASEFFETPCDVGTFGGPTVLLTPRVVYSKEQTTDTWGVGATVLSNKDGTSYFRLAGGSPTGIYIIGYKLPPSGPGLPTSTLTQGTYFLMRLEHGESNVIRDLPSQTAVFANDLLGVCVNSRNLEFTVDGGKTWRKKVLQLPASSEIQDLQWLSSDLDHLLLIGGNGYLAMLNHNEKDLKEQWNTQLSRPPTRAAILEKGRLVLAGNCRMYLVEVSTGKLLQELKTDLITKSMVISAGQAWVCGTTYVHGQPMSKVVTFRAEGDELKAGKEYVVAGAEYLFVESGAVSVIGEGRIYTLGAPKDTFVLSPAKIDNSEIERALEATRPDAKTLPTKEDALAMEELGDQIASETKTAIVDRAVKMQLNAKDRVAWITAQYREAAKHPDPKNPPITRQMWKDLSTLMNRLTDEQKVQYGERITREAPEFMKWTRYQQYQFQVKLAERMVSEAAEKGKPGS